MSESAAKQLAGFLGRFDPKVAAVARAALTKMRRRVPGAVELVYDNYNALAIGFSATERASDCIVSLAVFPKGVSLAFYYGATLPDPRGLLQGTGSQNRFLRLESAARLRDPAVEDLLRAAVAQGRSALAATGRGPTIIKSISAKQRPRRPPNRQ